MFDRIDYDKYFEQLFWEKRFFVLSIARKYVKDDATAKDIVQQTFLKIYLNIKKIGKLENIDGYIHRITVNETMDHFRKSKTMPAVSIDDISENLLPDRSVNTEHESATKAGITKFSDYILSLPVKRRSVVSLRIFEEKSFAEISKTLEISEVSARNLFSVAMKKFREKHLNMERKNA